MTPDVLLAGLAADPALAVAFLDHIPAAIGLCDADGRVVARNAGLRALCGDGPMRAGDLPLRAIEGPDWYGQVATGARAVPCTLTVAQPRAVRVTVLPMGVATAPRRPYLFMIADRDGQPVGPTAFESQYREVLSVVAHDLRNPLAAIKMTAQLLAKADDVARDKRVVYASRIVTSSQRMDALVKAIADYARTNGDDPVNVDPAPADLEQIVRQVVKDSETRHPEKKWQVTASGDLHGVWDKQQLIEAFSQLLSNAIRHGADDRPMSIHMDGGARDVVLLSVHNHGPCIPADRLDRVFEPFEIGPREPGSPRRSIGLGLFVVRRLVTAHQGRVDVRSNETDGTTFVVTLPRAALTAPDAPAEAVTAP